jgi:hypothetical protein
VASRAKEQPVDDHRLEHAGGLPAVQHRGGKPKRESHRVEVESRREIFRLEQRIGHTADLSLNHHVPGGQPACCFHVDPEILDGIRPRADSHDEGRQFRMGFEVQQNTIRPDQDYHPPASVRHRRQPVRINGDHFHRQLGNRLNIHGLHLPPLLPSSSDPQLRLWNGGILAGSPAGRAGARRQPEWSITTAPELHLSGIRGGPAPGHKRSAADGKLAIADSRWCPDPT